MVQPRRQHDKPLPGTRRLLVSVSGLRLHQYGCWFAIIGECDITNMAFRIRYSNEEAWFGSIDCLIDGCGSRFLCLANTNLRIQLDLYTSGSFESLQNYDSARLSRLHPNIIILSSTQVLTPKEAWPGRERQMLTV